MIKNTKTFLHTLSAVELSYSSHLSILLFCLSLVENSTLAFRTANDIVFQGEYSTIRVIVYFPMPDIDLLTSLCRAD